MGIKNIQGTLHINNSEVITTDNLRHYVDEITEGLVYSQLAPGWIPTDGERVYQCAGFAYNAEKVSNVHISSVYSGYPVIKIKEGAFDNLDVITSVVIPDSISAIGANAFSNCVNLKSINIPVSVTTMEEQVFSGCTNLTIYCEAIEQPKGWDANWNPDNCPVIWGAINSFNAVNDKFQEIEDKVLQQMNTIITNLGDMDEALARIIAIQEALIGTANEITATVNTQIWMPDGTAYTATETITALEGMTFAEWIDSDYAIEFQYGGRLYIDEFGLVKPQPTYNAYQFVDANWVANMHSTDVITDGATYIIA